MPAPPRRPDVPEIERSPAGVALRAVVGSILGLAVAISVAAAIGVVFLVARSPAIGLALGPVAGIWACAGLGWRERRSGDPAVAAGLLGVSVPLALLVLAWWVLAAFEAA